MTEPRKLRTFWTHLVRQVEDSGNWVEDADVQFNRPALCGETVWDYGTALPEKVTCPGCHAALKGSP